MSKISGQLLISEQFQDICDISGISGQLGAMQVAEYVTTSNFKNEQKSCAIAKMTVRCALYMGA